jgi:hypothetical protein
MPLSDDERAARALEVDPDRSNIIVCVGTKGSGKSEVARVIFEQWPYDRAVIDVTGDARPTDPTTRVMTTPWPATLPAADPDKGEQRVTAWLRVNPRSDTYEEDQDQALGLGLYPRHRNTLLWVDEYAQMATAAKIPPNLKLALQSSRHYHLTLVLCFPRPKYVPVLTISQADKVFIFRTPNKSDRETLADNMGFPKDLFERAYLDTMAGPEHAFLLWDSVQKRLFSCAPLPLEQTHGPRA